MLSNVSADCLLIEMWGLPSLSTTIGGEVEKPVGLNQSPPFVKNVNFLIESLGYWLDNKS